MDLHVRGKIGAMCGMILFSKFSIFTSIFSKWNLWGKRGWVQEGLGSDWLVSHPLPFSK